MCGIESIDSNPYIIIMGYNKYNLFIPLSITAVMQDLYDYVNPKNGRHCPMISEETNKIIQDNADVS